MPSPEATAWLKQNMGLQVCVASFGMGVLVGLAATGSKFKIQLDKTGAVIYVNPEELRKSAGSGWVPANAPEL